MGKFVIECPSCGRYAEAKTGFFAKKNIDCECGHTINVRTERMVTRICPHCGNTFIYDQSAGIRARCPVCHHKVMTIDNDTKMLEFSCAQCGIRLQTNKAAEAYTCPVCDHVNDVQKQLIAEKIKKDGLASIIKYEGDNNTLIWKHPIEDFNFGSQLIVHESQEAVFFQDGQALDLFGAGRYTLETQQLPLLEKLYELPTDTEGTFHSEVYFINKATQMAIKWGTPEKVRFIDPLTGVPLELGASGALNLQVANSRKLLLKLVGTMKGIAWDDSEGFAKSIQSTFRPLIITAVKTNLPAIIKESAIDLLEIDERLDIISARLREKLLPTFEEYGLTIPQFYVTTVVLPEDDPNFKRIRELHTITLQTRVYQAEAVVKTAQAQSEAQYRVAQEQSAAAIEAAHRGAVKEKQTTETEIARMQAERQILAAQAEAQSKRMDGLAEAEIMAAKGYSEKDVIQADVQKTYAASLGEIGAAFASGSGSAPGTGSGSGIVGDILGLGVGLATAGIVAPQIGEMMQGLKAPAQAAAVVPSTGWDCPACGAKNIQSRFCPDCGSKKPEASFGWICPDCGKTGITTNFCPNCGAKKPALGWDCPECGLKEIKTNFCPNCGHKKDE